MGNWTVKGTVTKTFTVTKDSNTNKCCYFELSTNQRMKKCIMVSTKILSSTTVFNIDNNKKCFLSSKSAL